MRSARDGFQEGLLLIRGWPYLSHKHLPKGQNLGRDLKAEVGAEARRVRERSCQFGVAKTDLETLQLLNVLDRGGPEVLELMKCC